MQKWVIVSLVCALFSSCSKESNVTEDVGPRDVSKREHLASVESKKNVSQTPRSRKEERINVFLGSLDMMSVEELVALISEPTAEQEEILSDHKAVAKIFQRLGKLSPEKALELSATLPLTFRMLATQYLFRSWGEVDFEKALEVANRLRPKSLAVQATKGAIIGLSEVQPDKAFQMAFERDDLNFLRDFFIAWSENDPISAYAKTEQLRERYVQEGMVSATVFNLMSNNDAEGVIDLLDASSAENKLVLLDVLNTPWRALDPTIITYLEEVTDPKEKEFADEVLETQGIYADPSGMAEEVLEVLSTSEGEESIKNYNVRALMTAYSESDAAAARVFFEQLPEGSFKNQAYPFYLINLGKFDPDSALQHILDHQNIGHTRGQYNAIGNFLMDENVQQRIEHVLQSDSPNAGFLLESMYNSWPFHDLPAARKFLEEIDPKPENINLLYRKVAGAYVHSPEEGLVWIETIDDPSIKNTATESLIGRWVREDIDSVTEWVNSIEVSPLRTVAAKELATSLMLSGQPDLSIEWAESIHDDAVRVSTLEDIFFFWNDSLPSDAKRWLEETEQVPEDVKEKMRAHPAYTEK